MPSGRVATVSGSWPDMGRECGNICHPDLRTQQPACSAGMPQQCPEKCCSRGVISVSLPTQTRWRHNRCSASEGRIPVAFSDLRTGKSSLLRVLSEAAPEIPANSAQQRYCPPSLISLPCILFPDVPFFPDAFSCRLPHLSVPLLIRQNSAGSLSSNARRNTFGSPLPATTSAIRTDMTLICRKWHRTKPI